jgi:hypothetical protein
MEKVLRVHLTAKQYEEAVRNSKECVSATTVEEDTIEDENALGMTVVLCGIRSQVGERLNGCAGKIESYDSSTGRYTVHLVAPPPGKATDVAVKKENMKRTLLSNEKPHFVHHGVGCDGCGVFPIIGRRYWCNDCSEAIGFDLFGDCYDAGVHHRSEVGRFNQEHQPSHKLSEIAQEETILHQLQRAHPGTPLDQLLDMLRVDMNPNSNHQEEDSA